MNRPARVLRPTAIYLAANQCLYAPRPPKAAPKALETRRCGHCKEFKPLDDFLTAGGVVRAYCAVCRVYCRDKVRRYTAARKKAPPAVPTSAGNTSFAVQSSLDRSDRPDGRLVARTEVNNHQPVLRVGVSPAIAGYLRAIGRG